MPTSKDSRPKTLIPREIGEILIDLFSEKTKFPMILFEEGIEDARFLETSTKYFTPFCRAMQEHGLHDRCAQDHLLRASECYKEQVTQCWAGLTNVAFPIVVGKKRKAVLLYGQLRENIPERMITSEARARDAIAGLPIDVRTTLLDLFFKLPLLPLSEIESNKLQDLKRLNKWLYSLISEKLRFEQDVRGVNHEWNINLQAALAKAEIHWMSINPSHIQYRESAKQLLYALRRIALVVQNFSKMYGEYRFSRHSLEKLIISSIEIYGSIATNKGVEVDVYTQDRSPFPDVIVSEHHFSIALNNLIHNAIKYSHSGFHRGRENPMTVDIVGRRQGSGYRLDIQNYGVGILPDEIAKGKIFEGGYKGELTKKEYRTGGGYGLPTAKEIIEKHRAQITVQSEHKSGERYLTTISIYFPTIVDGT